MLLVCQPPFPPKTETNPNDTSWAPGKKFGDAADDWQFWHGKIPLVLRKWHERGYKVAIISNQMGIGTGKADKQTVRYGTMLCVANLYCKLVRHCLLVCLLSGIFTPTDWHSSCGTLITLSCSLRQ